MGDEGGGGSTAAIVTAAAAASASSTASAVLAAVSSGGGVGGQAGTSSCASVSKVALRRDAAPQPLLLGASTSLRSSVSPHSSSSEEPARPPCKGGPASAARDLHSATSLEVSSISWTLPPVSGGTSFGVEFATTPRTRWKSRSQFVLVLMGYCIGIGNLWRFPYLCGRYGGGAFLVAYVAMLCMVAGPLFFYEAVLGQKFQKGPAETFRKMAPSWTGLAYVPVVMTIFYLPYYQLIIAYALHYFVNSFRDPLPWVDGTTPDRYLDEVVLYRVEGLGTAGSSSIHGTLLFEVCVVWLITVLCLVKGIHSAGKAAYVTVILPIIMISVLFFACINLDGANEGLYYYLMPRWGALFRPEVWGLAAGQIIFSLSPGTGTCISLASYHERDYRGLFHDCLFVAVCNSAFSLFGGLVVFSVVGNLSLSLGRPVEEVAASGEGLAFIVFAQGLAKLCSGGWTSFFAAMFFLTLFLLGLDSTFAVVETLQTYANDWLLSRDPSSKITTKGNALRLVLISLALCCLGLPYVTRGGYYLLEIADHFIVTYTLTTGVLLEYVMIGHFYEAEVMLDDVFVITGVQLSVFFVWQIKFIAPATIAFVLLLLFASDLSSGCDNGYPTWAVVLFGVLPVCISLSCVVSPWLQFYARRLIWGHIYPRLACWGPEALSAARQRARSGGFKRRDSGGSEAEADSGAAVTTDAAPLSLNRVC